MIKSILSALEKLKSAFKEQASSTYSCYKLLGYDILLDHNFKPHLIGEVETQTESSHRKMLSKQTLAFVSRLFG